MKTREGKLKCSLYGVITEVTMVRNVDSSSELTHDVPMCI